MNNKQDKYKENHFLAYHSQTAGDQKKKKKSLKACSKKKKKLCCIYGNKDETDSWLLIRKTEDQSAMEWPAYIAGVMVVASVYWNAIWTKNCVQKWEFNKEILRENKSWICCQYTYNRRNSK